MFFRNLSNHREETKIKLSKLIIDLQTTFASKTLFMKPYGQI